MKRAILVIALFLIGTNFIDAQTWQIHVNLNETYPIANKSQGYYPMLWYLDNTKTVLLGGFGLGVSQLRPYNEKINIKYQLNVQRSRLYDSPTIFKDVDGNLLGAVIGINTNLNLTGLVMPQWILSEKYKSHFGLGLGFRALAYSRTNYGEQFVHGELKKLRLKNTAQSHLLLTIPIAINSSQGRWSVAIRAETSINSTSKLSSRKLERSVIVFAEFGYLLSTSLKYHSTPLKYRSTPDK